MDNTLLSNAINDAFPQLEENLKQDIYKKIALHFILFLEEKILKVSPILKEKILRMELREESTRTQNYVQAVIDAYISLPQETQQRIDRELDSEITGIMHKIYKEVTK